MRIHTFYRLSVWLPLIVPALLAVIVRGLGVTPTTETAARVVSILLASLLYGGVPYAMLAIWATWWIDTRPEAEIRRLILRAPLLMMATFVAMSAVVGLVVGQTVMFLGVGLLGAFWIIPVGYGYVGLVLLLRESWGA